MKKLLLVFCSVALVGGCGKKVSEPIDLSQCWVVVKTGPEPMLLCAKSWVYEVEVNLNGYKTQYGQDDLRYNAYQPTNGGNFVAAPDCYEITMTIDYSKTYIEPTR